MTKELKALKDIGLWGYFDTQGERISCEKHNKEEFAIIKTALKKLEKWENLKISEEQAQWLMTLISNPEGQLDKLKAFEILKELLDDLFDEISFCDENHEILFNDDYGLWKSIILPKDKYDLIKKVLL